MRNVKTVLFMVVLSLVGGCSLLPDEGQETGPDGGGPPVISQTACGELSYGELSMTSLQFQQVVWPVDNTYGVNSFYLWEVDEAGTPSQPEYYFHSTGEPVGESLPAEDWQIPATDWAAARWNLDGLDPYHFSEADPFVVNYLPYVPSLVSWQSKLGSVNGGTCDDTRNTDAGDDNQNSDDTLVAGRFRCIGANELDRNSLFLQSRHTYLLQLSMVVFLGEDDDGYNRNRTQSCYRTIMTR